MPPNQHLRTARERAGLTRDKLADAVSGWLVERDPKGRDVPFDANHLGKIERGLVQRPRDHYVAALCAILHRSEAELGFDHESCATPEDVDRKAFLQAALGAGAGSIVSRYFPDHDASDLLAAVAGPTAHYGRLGDSASTVTLTPAVEAHLRLAASVITGVLPTRDGFAVLSEAAVLAAWVARERDDIGTARQHYCEAVQHAERAQHPLLTAFMEQSRGTFAIEAGNPSRGVALLERARKILVEEGARDAAQAHVASWLALGHAELGDREAALAELRKAESMIDSDRGEPLWPWLLGFGAAKAARYQAATLARLDDLSGARSAFAAAAPALVAPRPRAHALAGHAGALARGGHIDEASAAALEALTIAHEYGLERITQQIHDLRLVDVDNG